MTNKMYLDKTVIFRDYTFLGVRLDVLREVSEDALQVLRPHPDKTSIVLSSLNSFARDLTIYICSTLQSRTSDMSRF